MPMIPLAPLIVITKNAAPFLRTEKEPVLERMEATWKRFGQSPDNDLDDKAVGSRLFMAYDQFCVRHAMPLWLFLP
jgi:hypothetical protein